ncbi:MAG: hypothetical protein JNL01_05095 [Bdellovibrionales bacterium]|nr:hypothetical protein [Bdellovibrionales bacterium]
MKMRSGIQGLSLAWVVFAMAMAMAMAGCTTKTGSIGARFPAGVAIKLSEFVEQAREQVKNEIKDSNSCRTVLEDLYNVAFDMRFKDLDANDLSKNSTEISEKAFVARLELRQKLAALEKQGEPDGKCIMQIRNVLRVYRYIEETIGAYASKPKPYDENKVYPYLRGVAPYLQLNPRNPAALFPRHFKSGDILVSRGNAPTSALIARLGDVDGQFSHLALVYVDDNQQAWIMEAHIEVGSTVRKYEAYAADKNFRVTVFRAKTRADQEIAARSAKYMYERMNREKFPYDFGMVMDDEKELFCSEVAHVAYKHGSDGKFILGRYPTTFSPRNTSLLDDLGVQARSMFAPSDMELDTRFEILGEWKDMSRVVDNHYKDATLTMYLRWMEELNYRIHVSTGANFKAEVGYFFRHGVWLHEKWIASLMDLEKKFPLNMKKKTLETVLTFEQVANAVFEELKKRATEKKKQTGYPLSFKELYDVLDEIRKDDEKTYKNYRGLHESHEMERMSAKAPIFHKWFRAP